MPSTVQRQGSQAALDFRQQLPIGRVVAATIAALEFGFGEGLGKPIERGCQIAVAETAAQRDVQA